MIEKRTVFILGAGAHCSYGFPSGKSLKEKVVKAVRDSLSPESPYNFQRLSAIYPNKQKELGKDTVDAFATALENSGQASIDAFLFANHHQVGYETIGKAAIAQVLLQCEQNKQISSDDDWLSYLFEVMLDGAMNPVDFQKNRVGFVTFNYDGFLERWLLNKLEYSYGADAFSAQEWLKEIPIHHVYGKLSSYDTEAVPCEDAWIEASNGIRTIFDAEKSDNEIADSKKLIAEAEVVCLLGYGFHRENTELLSLVENLQRPNCVVISSRFGLTNNEWSRLTKQFVDANISISNDGSEHYKCLYTLRNQPVFS